MNKEFYDEIKKILTTARNKVYQTANFTMVEAYWNIGKSIIEEQGGKRKGRVWNRLVKRIIKTNDTRFWQGFYCRKLKEYATILFNISK